MNLDIMLPQLAPIQPIGLSPVNDLSPHFRPCRGVEQLMEADYARVDLNEQELPVVSSTTTITGQPLYMETIGALLFCSQ